jgi:hypothetical protein
MLKQSMVNIELTAERLLLKNTKRPIAAMMKAVIIKGMELGLITV